MDLIRRRRKEKNSDEGEQFFEKKLQLVKMEI